jgi:hypothetical protein
MSAARSRARAAGSPRCGRARIPLIERSSQRVVERLEPDLVACRDRARGADQMCAGAAFLRGDDRPQHAIDGGVEALDEWMVLVES